MAEKQSEVTTSKGNKDVYFTFDPSCTRFEEHGITHHTGENDGKEDD